MAQKSIDQGTLTEKEADRAFEIGMAPPDDFSIQDPSNGSLWNDRVDLGRLLIEWTGIWVLTGVAFYSVRKRTANAPRKASEATPATIAVASPAEAAAHTPPGVAPWLPVVVQTGLGKVYEFPTDEQAKQFESTTKQAGGETFRLVRAGRTPTPETPESSKRFTVGPKDVMAVVAGTAQGKSLWQNLLVKVLHDEATALRLVQFEYDELKRKGLPEIPIVDLMRRANERWERENSG
jgi:hypothetical protein